MLCSESLSKGHPVRSADSDALLGELVEGRCRPSSDTRTGSWSGWKGVCLVKSVCWRRKLDTGKVIREYEVYAATIAFATRVLRRRLR